ncbi:Zn-ribbon domain-containing OB-fold protein [Burkholderia cenocepacia]|uniref:Zn-ribbon domain-containing OB-fold protein n=1 Tax=Burkholderia cenocepacia TaxID=95486 RepID=UPI002AB6196D|nr:OB-fold domain-containing protein [Burkholderia cenocepacia]
MTNETMPLREGLFRETSQGAVLIGTRCRACGQVHFPATGLCLECLAEDVEECELSREGELFCETTVHMKTAHFSPPYQVGYVKLPEGLKIFAPLRPVEGRPFTVGMKMRVEIASLWSEDGHDVAAYRFYPC